MKYLRFFKTKWFFGFASICSGFFLVLLLFLGKLAFLVLLLAIVAIIFLCSFTSICIYCFDHGHPIEEFKEWILQIIKSEQKPQQIKEEEKMVLEKREYLYRVYICYAEDRKSPVIEEQLVIADSQENAKVKSGVLNRIKPEWDTDFLTIYASSSICSINTKKSPTEVKIVK